MNINELRKQIPATQEMIYMNTGWSGPSSKRVVEEVQRYMEMEAFGGPASPPILEKVRETAQKTKEEVAGLLGCSADEVLLTQNTTEGLNVVMSGFPWNPGDEIVTCSIEHPSVMVPCRYHERKDGVKVKIAELDPMDDPQTILSKLEAKCSSETRLIALSHIQFSCGLRLPIKEINDMAHKNGALVLWDGAQTAGQIYLNMHELNCDFYATPGHKWLMGPDGTGALFIRQDLIPMIEPIRVGGSLLSSPTEDNAISRQENIGSITKFRLSTQSGPLLAAQAQAIAFVQEIGIREIEERARFLGSVMRSALSEIEGIKITSPLEGDTTCGLVTIAVEDHDPSALVRQLWTQGNIAARQVAQPNPGVRFSTAFFNTEQEIAKVKEALIAILNTPEPNI